MEIVVTTPSEEVLSAIRERPTDVHNQLAVADLVELPEGAHVDGSVSIYGIEDKADARAVAEKLAEISGLPVNEPGAGYSWFEVGYSSGNLTVHYDRETITTETRCSGCPLVAGEV